jgi:quinol monooxygenase YgiN
MATTIVRHPVKDYAAWRKVFDEFKPAREKAGERSATVLRVEGRPNDVVVVNTWRSIEAAKAFFAAADLKEGMARGGVVGQPDIVYANEV